MNKIIRFGNRLSVSWNKKICLKNISWLKTLNKKRVQQQWANEGFCIIENILREKEVELYRSCYELLYDGSINCTKHRHDLGSHIVETVIGRENTGQIMWPSEYTWNILTGPLHKRTSIIASFLIDKKSSFDFDMLIYKDKQTNTNTPWHQDEAYWPVGLDDKQSASCWIALDNVSIENGCIWFLPKCNKNFELKFHQQAKKGSHVLFTDDVLTCSGKPVPLQLGSATFHSKMSTLCWTKSDGSD